MLEPPTNHVGSCGYTCSSHYGAPKLTIIPIGNSTNSYRLIHPIGNVNQLTSDGRVFGGSHMEFETTSTSSYRDDGYENVANEMIGFRLAEDLTADQEPSLTR